MTTAATSLLGLALPVTGELSGTWGDTVNNSITSLLDTAVAGTTTLSTDADVTLTTTTLASNQARQAILLCSGARTALRTITAPAQSKIYTIINATTGGYSVKLVGVGPTTGLTIPNGASAVVAWNGSDFIEVGSATVGNLTVNGNLSVTGTTSLTGVATLTANPVLSAGTANGVAYLNGSKVVTTGSALTFDGTNFASSGNITSGGVLQALTTVQSSSGADLSLNANGANRDVIWKVNATELARLVGSTGNLGIGTSSPGAKLGIDTSGTSGYWQRFYNSGTELAYFYFDSTTLQLSSKSSTRALTFLTNDTERMRLDSSGNLGLGVTPSAWSTTWKAFQTTGGSIVGSTSNIRLAQNWYHDGTSRYVSSRPAAMFVADDGAFTWYNAPSGTAGNAITFTQAMTLDASGNLVVGSTSTNGKFSVSNAGANGFEVYPDSLPDSTSGTRLQSYNRSTSAYVPQGYNASDFRWYTSSTERARIDSSGNLLVGTTSTSGTSGIGIKNLVSATAPDIAVVGSSTSSGDVGFQLYSTGAAAYRFYVAYNGTISATSTTISAISDIRFKENVRDLNAGLAEIMALKPRLYDWKEGKGQDIKNARGFIAQEFEQVFPDLIDEWKDPAPEGEEPYKSVRADLIPVLVKAIQEQQAIINQLKADVAALKGQ